LVNNHGGTADGPAITTDAADVPLNLQEALARILMAADAAATARDDYLTTFFGAYDPVEPPDTNVWHIAYNRAYAFRVPVDNNFILPFTLFGLSTPDGGTTWEATVQPFACVFNYLLFAQAMVDLAHALDQADSVLSAGVSGTFSFDQDSPIGKIVINSGDGPTTYAAGDYVLICDCDGGDTYNCSAGANSSILNPISICLDLAGSDTYNAIDDYTDGVNTDYASQQGTGRWGVGILVDYNGDDEYHASLASQGSGIFGWGLLYDKTGNDTYFGVDHVQGSGLCGVGILYDGGGQDSYHCWHGAQGFGDIWGLGILCDQGSDPDDYYAEWDATVGPAVFASPQNTDINANFAQGAAFGLRTTANFPVLWDGGVGALIDAGGDDDYTCGVFGQGVGFWFCTGVLDDRGGNDQYEGDWYVQAATAHYACSILMDRAGDDDYNKNYATRGFPLQNVTVGGAHDHSVSWLLDGAGSDEYYVPGLSLGTGNVNGWGYFIDMGSGTDTYSPTDAGFNTITLGRGHLSGEVPDGDAREQEKTFGLFIDCGGADTYAATYATIPSGSIGDVNAGDNLGWFRYGYTNDFAGDFRSNEFGTGLDDVGTTGFEF
jgi:hypothetical protein